MRDGWLALELGTGTLFSVAWLRRQSRKSPVELPVELERILRRAAGFADELLSDLAGLPGMTGLDVWVGAPDRRSRRRPQTVFMSAFLARWPGPNQQPVPLEHVEPLITKSGPKQPWVPAQTAEAARDGMERALREWVAGRPVP